jgi:hypothetical protein
MGKYVLLILNEEYVPHNCSKHGSHWWATNKGLSKTKKAAGVVNPTPLIGRPNRSPKTGCPFNHIPEYALLHGKPAPSGAFYESYCAQGDETMDTLRRLNQVIFNFKYI